MEKLLGKYHAKAIIREVNKKLQHLKRILDRLYKEKTNIKTDDSIYSDDDYLNFNPFEGDFEEGIRCRTIKMVKTRKDHQCALNDHIIPKGSIVRFEKAIVDGKWGSYYVCKPCMNNWFREIGV